MAAKLNQEQLSQALAELNANSLLPWQIGNNKLHKTIVFKDFNHAFSFMTSVALKAEQMNHHPEWFNVYNRLEVDLITHSVSGISELDFTLARFMETLG